MVRPFLITMATQSSPQDKATATRVRIDAARPPRAAERVDPADVQLVDGAPRVPNPKESALPVAILTTGAIVLGVYLLHEFLMTPTVAQASPLRPTSIGPVPTPKVPIPTPTMPKVRLGVLIADKRAHFASFDTDKVRVITSASGRSITVVTATLPLEMFVSIAETAEPVTEITLNDGAQVDDDAESGHDFKFTILNHSTSMDDPSVQMTVRHSVNQSYSSDDLLQIFVLSP